MHAGFETFRIAKVAHKVECETSAMLKISRGILPSMKWIVFGLK